MSLIAYNKVRKSFGSDVIYRDFNLEINSGEVVGIIGPSGVGKTVAIKMLIGLVPIDDGEIFFNDKKFTKNSVELDFMPLRKEISMVFQGAALFDSMTVEDNVAYPLFELGGFTRREVKDIVSEKLELVGLLQARGKKPSELSGGMKKRVGLARAIATNPSVILYDEPTAGLDPINTARITALIEKLQDEIKCTSVLVTHDIPFINRLSKKIAFIGNNRVLSVDNIDELRKSEIEAVKLFFDSYRFYIKG